MLRVFEAFSGYGSQSLALKRLGIAYEVVAISEIDKYAVKAYEALHGAVCNLGDICSIAIEDVPNHDLFTYSFPCQSISTAGKQRGLARGSGTRSSLLWECERIIAAKKPKYLLMENVKNLLGEKNKPDFDSWCNWLETQGYVNFCKVLNAKDYGVPQNRERVFLVSILDAEKPYVFPSPVFLNKTLKDVLDDVVEDNYYIETEASKKLLQKVVLDTKFIKSKVAKSNLKEVTQICVGHVPYATNTNKLHQSTAVYAEDGLSPTLLASSHRSPLKVMRSKKVQDVVDVCTASDYIVRKLTAKEYFRLMGLREEDIRKIQDAGISRTQQYKLAGNSIVIPVLEQLFSSLLM